MVANGDKDVTGGSKVAQEMCCARPCAGPEHVAPQGRICITARADITRGIQCLLQRCRNTASAIVFQSARPAAPTARRLAVAVGAAGTWWHILGSVRAPCRFHGAPCPIFSATLRCPTATRMGHACKKKRGGTFHPLRIRWGSKSDFLGRQTGCPSPCLQRLQTFLSSILWGSPASQTFWVDTRAALRRARSDSKDS